MSVPLPSKHPRLTGDNRSPCVKDFSEAEFGEMKFHTPFPNIPSALLVCLTKNPIQGFVLSKAFLYCPAPSMTVVNESWWL